MDLITVSEFESIPQWVASTSCSSCRISCKTECLFICFFHSVFIYMPTREWCFTHTVFLICLKLFSSLQVHEGTSDARSTQRCCAKFEYSCKSQVQNCTSACQVSQQSLTQAAPTFQGARDQRYERYSNRAQLGSFKECMKFRCSLSINQSLTHSCLTFSFDLNITTV